MPCVPDGKASALHADKTWFDSKTGYHSGFV